LLCLRTISGRRSGPIGSDLDEIFDMDRKVSNLLARCMVIRVGNRACRPHAGQLAHPPSRRFRRFVARCRKACRRIRDRNDGCGHKRVHMRLQDDARLNHMRIMDLGAVDARQRVGEKVHLFLVVAFKTQTIARAQHCLEQRLGFVCRHQLSVCNAGCRIQMIFAVDLAASAIAPCSSPAPFHRGVAETGNPRSLEDVASMVLDIGVSRAGIVRRQTDGLMPITRRNILQRCAWSHSPHATATWQSGCRVTLISVHASSTRRLAM
jgi:hypothetical protein